MHPTRLQSAAIGFALSLSLLGCAAPPAADPPANSATGGSKHAAMMDDMCKKHAAKSAKSADAGAAPGMMDKHCKPEAASAAASAASAPPAAAHVH